MLNRFATLFPHEQQELLEALRRDLRAESCKIETDPEYGGFHAANCRVVGRLLETLSPKHGPRHAPACANAAPTCDGRTQAAVDSIMRHEAAPFARTLRHGAHNCK